MEFIYNISFKKQFPTQSYLNVGCSSVPPGMSKTEAEDVLAAEFSVSGDTMLFLGMFTTASKVCERVWVAVAVALAMAVQLQLQQQHSNSGSNISYRNNGRLIRELVRNPNINEIRGGSYR